MSGDREFDPRFADPETYARHVAGSLVRQEAKGRGDRKAAEILREELVGAWGVLVLIRTLALVQGSAR